MLKVSNDYKDNCKYDIEGLINLLQKYLPEDVKETEIENIKDLKIVLLKNKREIIENIIDTNPDLLFNIELSSGLGQVKEMYSSLDRESSIARLRLEMPTWLSNNDFIKLCLSIYEIANGKNNEKGAIIEDYKDQITHQITKILPKLQEKKLSKDVQRRYNSKEVLVAFRFLNSLLPKDKRGYMKEEDTLNDFIGKNSDEIQDAIGDSTLSLDNIYRTRQLLKLLKKDFPRTAEEIYITDEMILNIDYYKNYNIILSEKRDFIIDDLVEKGYKKEEIDDSFIKSYFSKRLGKEFKDLVKEPKNELSKLDRFVKNGEMTIDFYNQILNLINKSSEKLDIDKLMNLFFSPGEEKLSIFINQFGNKDKVVKLINSDIVLIFDKLSSFNLDIGLYKFISIFKSVDLDKFITLFNTIKKSHTSLNTFFILLLELPIEQIKSLINNIKIENLLQNLKINKRANNLIHFCQNLKKDIFTISIPWESFFDYGGDVRIYRKIAYIADETENQKFSIKTLQLSNTYGKFALFDLSRNIGEKEIVKYINGDKRGFLKGELSLVDLYKKKIGKSEIWK